MLHSSLTLHYQQVTVNGKKVELPVKHIISGSSIKPSGTLLNPHQVDALSGTFAALLAEVSASIAVPVTADAPGLLDRARDAAPDQPVPAAT